METLNRLSCRGRTGSKVKDSSDSPRQKQHLRKCKIIGLNRKEYTAINFIQAVILRDNQQITEIHIITSQRIEIERASDQTLILQKETRAPEETTKQIRTPNRRDPTPKDSVVPKATARINKNVT